MAEQDDISLRVSVKGADQAARTLKELVGEVRKTEGGVAPARGGRARDDDRGSTRGPGQSGPGAGTIAAGQLLASAAQQTFSALQQSVVQAFDPLATRQERQTRFMQAGIGLVPFVGNAASQIFGLLAENQLAPARNTAQRIGQILDPAIRASGLTDPEQIKERFGGDINALNSLFAPQEKASRAGQQAIADVIGQDLDLGKLKDDAIAQARKAAEDLGIPVEAFQNAVDNFKENTKSFEAAVTQIVEHWKGVINGNRSVFEGLRR